MLIVHNFDFICLDYQAVRVSVPSEPAPGATAAASGGGQRDVVKATGHAESGRRKGFGRSRKLTSGSVAVEVEAEISEI